MSFLDKIFGDPLKKHARRVGTRDAQPEDRETSARWLLDNGSPEALTAVFKRFELQLEHSLKDKKEKELVFDLLVETGPAAAVAARDFARTSVHFQWAVAVIDKVEGPGAGTRALIDMLAAQRVEDEFKPEKKRTLLLFLAERQDSAIAPAAARFLTDFDEGVRHAAIEAISAQGASQESIGSETEDTSSRDLLAAALINPREESTRIRGRLAEIFATRSWPVPEDAALQANVPVGFRLVEGRLQRR
jgi:hypothetical protein